jgi:transglutaminase-like putative cysteine protease
MHKLFRRRGAAVAAWLLAAVASAHAAGENTDLPARYRTLEAQYVVNDDMTSTETRHWAITVLKPQAIEWAKHARVSHSTSVQKVDILQAYTQKADGRRVDVPKDNYQLNVNKGRELDGPAFSDYSTVSVVFPDVAVGDTVVFGYRITQREPIFPGHFDAGQVFSSQDPYDSVTIGVEYPAALAVRFEGRRMEQREMSPAPGRKAVQWRWANPNPVRSTRRDYSVFDPDQEIGFDFSTFAGYSTIALEYGKRATPKAAVTDRIRTLAAEIVGERKDQREQAKALYDWVASTITYGGNCVGVGTVVPRDLDVVLDNRMGDCKDHATLLQALLSARGIRSRQALVNAGSMYTLPRIPRVSSVNHVINDLPDLGMFVDATADGTPFGTLPIALRGKPVLIAEPGAAAATLPVPGNASDQKTVSNLKLAADGSLSGTIEVHYKGDVAIGMRAWARELPQDQRADLVKNMLRSMSLNGSGSVELDDPTEVTDRYRIKLTLARVEKYLKLPGPGAFQLVPLVGGVTIGRVVSSNPGEPATHPGTCTNGSATESYTIELPRGMKVTALPASIRLANSIQRYEASYVQKGQLLKVNRVVEDRTPVAVCPPSILDEYAKFGEKVHDNLAQQVLYR